MQLSKIAWVNLSTKDVHLLGKSGLFVGVRYASHGWRIRIRLDPCTCTLIYIPNMESSHCDKVTGVSTLRIWYASLAVKLRDRYHPVGVNTKICYTATNWLLLSKLQWLDLHSQQRRGALADRISVFKIFTSIRVVDPSIFSSAPQQRDTSPRVKDVST